MDHALICRYSETCSGCSDWVSSAPDQLQRKKENVLDLLKGKGLAVPQEISTAELPDRALRDRLDFQILEGKIGLWDKDRQKLVDLDLCLQLSPALQDWLEDFRKIKIPIKKGSFRLRTSPSGQRGLWLDLANDDVKQLFEEKTTLLHLSEMALVEVGQRRKALVFENGTPKLHKEPRFHDWSRTWIKNESFPLFSRIADFTQVGDQANRAIIASLTSLLSSGRQLLEFGSGNGNLSFAASAFFDEIHCFESDESVSLGFQKSVVKFQTASRGKNIHLHVGHRHDLSSFWRNADSMLVNPPRSGVGSFLQNLGSSSIKNLIYMSCYPESMAQDLSILGPEWTCQKIIFIDQFPHTNHIETLSLWQR